MKGDGSVIRYSSKNTKWYLSYLGKFLWKFYVKSWALTAAVFTIGRNISEIQHQGPRILLIISSYLRNTICNILLVVIGGWMPRFIWILALPFLIRMHTNLQDCWNKKQGKALPVQKARRSRKNIPESSFCRAQHWRTASMHCQSCPVSKARRPDDIHKRLERSSWAQEGSSWVQNDSS